MRFSNAMLVVAVTLGLTLCCAAMPREMLAHQDIDAMYEPSKQVLADGRTRVNHNYHFTHPEHGTYVKKNMQGVIATHKYAFVNLDNQAESVQFSAVAKDMTMEMTIVTPSSTLRAELLVRTLSVVVVGTRFADSQGRHVMHHVLSEVRSDSTTIVLKVAAASYDQLFEELSVSYNTNHVLSAGEEVTPRGDDVALPATGLTYDSSRAGAVQGIGLKIFDWIKKQFSNSNILETVKKTVKSLGLDLFNSVKITLLTGALNFDKSYGLGQLSYNRNVNTQWQNVTQKWSVTTGPVRFGASALLDLTLNLGVNIASYKFVNQSLTLSGALSAEVAFQATPSLGTQAAEDRLTLTTLQIKPLSFSVASVSVQLTAQLPIYGGYSAEGTAPLDITTTFSATGTIKIGYVFDNTVTDPKQSKFKTFCTPAFQYSGSIGGSATGNFAGRAYVEPVLLVGINFIGGGSLVFHLGAETTVTAAPAGQTAPACPISAVMNVQPVFTVSAKIDVQVLNTRLYGPQQIGPNDVYTKVIEIVRLCSKLPQLPGRVFKPSAAIYEPSTSDLASVYSSQDAVCGSHQVSLQVGDVSENGMTMYANVENHNENGVFTTQQQFAVARKDRKLSFTHVPSSLDYRNDARQEFVKSFEGEMSADGDSIALFGFAGCPQAAVSRSKLVTVEAKPAPKKGGNNVKAVLPAAVGGAGFLVAVAAALVVVSRRRAAAARAAQEQLVEATA